MTPLEHLARTNEKRLRSALSMSIASAQRSIDVEALAAAVRAQDEAAIRDGLGIASDRSTRLLEALGAEDGDYGAAILFLVLSSARKVADQRGFSLDILGPEVITTTSSLVKTVSKAVSKGSASAALGVIERGTLPGEDARGLARRTVRALSLTPDQALSLDTFERVLTRIATPKPSARRQPLATPEDLQHLGAAQRSTIRKFAASDPQPGDVPELVRREATAMLAFRLDVIARQESLRAVNAGQQTGFEQAVSVGALPSTVRRFWITAGDERVRHDHAEVADMNPEGVGVSEAFATPLGAAMYPPLEINCRCQVALVGGGPPAER